MNLKNEFDVDIAKKILGNKDRATLFLKKLEKLTDDIEIPFRVITRGKNIGKRVISLDTNQLWKKIVDNWDYKNGLEIVRDLFRDTNKYKSGKESHSNMKMLLDEWDKLELKKISWPFSQGDFDGFVQRVNSEGISGSEKDEKVGNAAVKYRRIKEINTVRNDFIETLIFEKNENILPTLNHRRSVDFFIDGVSFDQKVAKSPTSQFQKDFGDSWRQHAVENPEKVAEYLYTHQDEGRFGADSRLLVVYLDEGINIERISKIIQETNLRDPLEVTFKYNHKNHGLKSYTVNCFVVLLYN